jgi:16S rRNA (uracil1498-N3)-methyltransferase
MKLHRFIGEFNLKEKEVNIDNPEIVRQIKTVLRLKIGDSILLSDGKGMEARGVILDTKKDIKVGIQEAYEVEDSKRKVSLYLAILKKENFEFAVQKAVETGVTNIIPVITERTIKTGTNVERLEKIIREASEQSGRATLPNLYPIKEFRDALKDGSISEERIIFRPGDREYKPNKEAKTVSVFVGPEGGFSEKEIALAEEQGYQVASLGDLILRGETAATIASYRAVQGI